LNQRKRSGTRFAWSRDVKQIAFRATNAKSEAEESKQKEQDDARVADKDNKHRRLWILNLADNSERAVTPANFDVSDLAWFPEGNSLAVIATDHPESDRNTERIFLVQTNAASDSNSAMKQLSVPRDPFANL